MPSSSLWQRLTTWLRVPARRVYLAACVYGLVAIGSVSLPWLKLGLLGSLSGWEMEPVHGRLLVACMVGVLFFASYNLVFTADLIWPAGLLAVAPVGILVDCFFVLQDQFQPFAEVARVTGGGEPVGWGSGFYLATLMSVGLVVLLAGHGWRRQRATGGRGSL